MPTTASTPSPNLSNSDFLFNLSNCNPSIHYNINLIYHSIRIKI
jgi:hypothetical protein